MIIFIRLSPDFEQFRRYSVILSGEDLFKRVEIMVNFLPGKLLIVCEFYKSIVYKLHRHIRKKR